MDLLSDVLTVTRMGSAVVAQAELLPPWGIEVDPIAEAHIHVVLRGSCWLRTSVERAYVPLATSDVVMIRGGVGHSIVDDPKTTPAPIAEVLAAMPRRLARLPAARASETTVVLCAKYLFQHVGAHPLTSLLPPLIHVRAREATKDAQLQLLLQLLRGEVRGEARGADLVVPRLVDTLLVFVVRAWLEGEPLGTGGFHGALRDPAIARALSLLHARPDARWSVEGLAKEVAQSRATFARRFTELVGETPAAYLTRWRMCLATKLLAETELSLDEVAVRVGYETAPAFSKAFRRLHGRAPGAFRTAARTELATRSAVPTPLAS